MAVTFLYGYTLKTPPFTKIAVILFVRFLEMKALAHSNHHVFTSDKAQLQGSGNRLITVPAAT